MNLAEHECAVEAARKDVDASSIALRALESSYDGTDANAKVFAAITRSRGELARLELIHANANRRHGEELARVEAAKRESDRAAYAAAHAKVTDTAFYERLEPELSRLVALEKKISEIVFRIGESVRAHNADAYQAERLSEAAGSPQKYAPRELVDALNLVRCAITVHRDADGRRGGAAADQWVKGLARQGWGDAGYNIGTEWQAAYRILTAAGALPAGEQAETISSSIRRSEKQETRLPEPQRAEFG